MVGKDSFQRADKNFVKPDYKRTLAALSFGGPIVKDKIHIFGSYEGNYQNRNNQVAIPAPPAGFPALDTVNLTKYNGSFLSPFRESLFFGKLSDEISDKSHAELSFSNRHETDVRDFGGNQALLSANNFHNYNNNNHYNNNIHNNYNYYNHNYNYNHYYNYYNNNYHYN